MPPCLGNPPFKEGFPRHALDDLDPRNRLLELTNARVLGLIFTRVKRERTVTGTNKQQPSKNRMMRSRRSALVGVYQVH